MSADGNNDGVVDGTMPLKPRLPIERLRDDHDLVVTATRRRPGVAGVVRAVVADRQVGRLEPFAEDLLDRLDSPSAARTADRRARAR